jgi:hypothetical protein
LNKYQLEETVQTVANWLGFTTRNSASLIFSNLLMGSWMKIHLGQNSQVRHIFKFESEF